MSAPKSMGYIAIVITILTVVQKFFGFFREIVLSYFYGTSPIVDYISMAGSATEVCMGFITAISLMFTPLYAKYREQENADSALGFLNQALTLILLLGSALGLFVTAFSGPILSVVAPGFSSAASLATGELMRYTVLGQIASALQSTLVFFLNYHGAYLRGTLVGMAFSPVQMAMIAMGGICGEEIFLAWSLFFPQMLCLLLGVLFSLPFGFRFRFAFRPTDHLSALFTLLIPTFIANAISYINITIDKIFGSYLTEGSLAALQYAFNLRALLVTIFTVAFSTMLFPILSKAVAKNDLMQAGKVTEQGIRWITIFFFPITVAFCLLATPILQLLYGGGEFGAESISLTSGTLVCYSIGLWGVAIREYLTRVHYALGTTKQLMFTWIVTILVNVGGNFLLVERYQASGLALATSISILATVPAIYWTVKRQIPSLSTRGISRLVIGCALASCCMGGVVFWLWRHPFSTIGTDKGTLLAALLFTALIGSLFYFFLLACMKVPEMLEVKSQILDRLHPHRQ